MHNCIIAIKIPRGLSVGCRTRKYAARNTVSKKQSADTTVHGHLGKGGQHGLQQTRVLGFLRLGGAPKGPGSDRGPTEGLQEVQGADERDEGNRCWGTTRRVEATWTGRPEAVRTSRHPIGLTRESGCIQSRSSSCPQAKEANQIPFKQREGMSRKTPEPGHKNGRPDETTRTAGPDRHSL